MTTTPKDIAGTVQRLRSRAGFTQEQLAVAAGLSLSTLQKIESGASKNPTVATMGKIRGACRSARRQLSRRKA